MTALTIENLTKVYKNGFQALKGISLTVAEGDFFALLGANGAGKSTTIGILTSLINKTSGKITVFGHDIDTDPSAVKSCIGLVPQEFNCNIFERCEQILCTQGGYYGLPQKVALERAQYYLNKLELWDKRNEVVKSLSGGMKRRLMIARALVHQPKMLILDEPTAGVDIEIRHSMWDFLQALNENGTTIILTTHYLEEAEMLCRNVAMIKEGAIALNSTMHDLLVNEQQRVFTVELNQPLDILPAFKNFIVKQLEDKSILEVTLTDETNLNTLFEELSAHQLQVHNIFQQQQSLENLFLGVLKNDA